MASEHSKIAKALERVGWRFRGRQRNHYKMTCPCGRHIVVFPQTASDRRAVKNTRSQIRRFAKDGCSGIPSL